MVQPMSFEIKTGVYIRDYTTQLCRDYIIAINISYKDPVINQRRIGFFALERAGRKGRYRATTKTLSLKLYGTHTVDGKNPANSPVEVGSLSHYLQLGGGFKDSLCSPLPGELIQFD